MKHKVGACLAIILCFLVASIIGAYASPVDNISLRGAGVIVDLEYPEEAHPTETITINVTITALLALKLQNFTLIIRVLLNATWQQVYKEQVLQLNMDPNEVLTRLVWFTLPSTASESLCYDMYVLTDKAPGLPANYVFYATHVRAMTYNELLETYYELFANYSSLLNLYHNLTVQYDGLNTTYNLLLNQYISLQATYEALSSSYYTQKASYDTLKTDYQLLEADYRTLNQTYYALRADLGTENDSLKNTVSAQNTQLDITRNVAYALLAVTLILTAFIIYNKKKKSEPYVVLRKETVTLKPVQEANHPPINSNNIKKSKCTF